MSWVCPMCSSNNESSERACIVCGETRPGIGLSFDIQSQMNNASGSFSSLLNAYKAVNVEEEFDNALDMIKSNPRAGFEKMLECAKRGYPPAQNEVGDCYYYGIGVSQDFSQALLWFEKAAQQDIRRDCSVPHIPLRGRAWRKED